jgi:hypothetical protein
MNLDDEFRVLNRIATPSLRPDIDERVRRPESDPQPRRALGHSWVAAVLALAIFAAAAAFGWRVWESGSPAPATPPPVGDPWSSAPEGWSELPLPPELPTGALLVWAGDRLISWGGSLEPSVGNFVPTADGFSYDPAANEWTPIPPAPIAGSGQGLWTGSELLIWDVDGRRVEAFNPASGTWRRLADDPHKALGNAWVWTGRELIVWGGRPGDEEAATAEGAALDPASGTWRAIASAPFAMSSAEAVWVNRELIVVGSELDGGNHASTRTAIALAYDPVTNLWRRLADAPVSPQTSDLELIDGRVIAWEAYTPATAEYLPTEDRWRELDPGNLVGQDVCVPQGAAIPAGILTWGCGRPAVWRPAMSSWSLLQRPRAFSDPQIHVDVATVVAAGNAVVVDNAESVRRGRNVYVGFGGRPAPPRHFWLWKPAASES